MLEMLQHSTTLWVALSFVLFLIIAVKFGGKAVLDGLDKKIAEIRDEIQNAERLKKEAQDLLVDFENKQRDAQQTAAKIIEQAKSSARAIHAAAEEELALTMQRKEAQLSERLKRIEEKAAADIQNHAADLAIKATREIVQKALDERQSATLLDQSISSVAKHLN